MTDYTKTDGGTIMIRDTGTDVEYWFKAKYASDWYNGLTFSWTTSGGTATRDINYPTGAQWYKVGESTITVSQNVTFRQVDSSSVSGIGPAKSLTVYIQRGTVPSAPGVFRVLSYTDVRVDGDVNGGTTGGSPILQRQIAWGTSPNVPGNGGGFGNLNLSTGSGFITGLTPGYTYYFWNRARNAIGWGPWSARTSLRMKNQPDPPDYPALYSRTQTSITLRVLANYDGASPIQGYRIRYGLSPDAPTNIISSTSNLITINNLSPGATYYFWGQAYNIYGDSYYSARSYASLIAGAKVKVAGVWRRAVPYVKVAGVWKVARPWGRIAGFWNETPE